MRVKQLNGLILIVAMFFGTACEQKPEDKSDNIGFRVDVPKSIVREAGDLGWHVDCRVEAWNYTWQRFQDTLRMDLVFTMSVADPEGANLELPLSPIAINQSSRSMLDSASAQFALEIPRRYGEGSYALKVEAYDGIAKEAVDRTIKLKLD